MKRTADELNEMQIHSLPAGGTSSLSLVSGVNIHVQFISCSARAHPFSFHSSSVDVLLE